jgi:beta-glucosidase
VFPNASCLASSFDPALVERIGAEIGKECQLKSTQLLMGPTINLHRDPRGGRNFECFSEDPVLTGLMGSAYVKGESCDRGCIACSSSQKIDSLAGLQSQRVGACLKHLVCNERETKRKAYDVKVSDKTLREVYLRPFEMIINDAKPYSIMTAYNDIVRCFGHTGC